jgi:DNA-binding CsgD family transcriptional regulator
MGPSNRQLRRPLVIASRLAGVAIANTGVLVVDSDLQVLAANSMAEQIVDRADALTLSAGVLRAIRSSDHVRLKAACHGAATKVGDSWHGIALSRRSGQRDYLLSIAKANLSEVQGGGLHVSIVDPESCFCLPVEQLQTYFGLTPAQSDLTRLLGNGYRLKEAATKLGIKVSTARTHLAAIFRKTRTDRIPALVRVLALLWSANQLQLAVTHSASLPDLN